MQELRLILIILGAIAIGALLIHGIWSNRKERAAVNFKKNPAKNTPKIKKAAVDASGFDQDGIGKVRVRTVEPDVESLEKNDKIEPVIDEIIPSLDDIDDAHISVAQAERKDVLAVRKQQKEQFSQQDEPAEKHELESPITEPVEHEKTLLIVLHVQAQPHTEFEGRKLIASMEQNGLKFGDMNLYHRHFDLAGVGKVLFSVANSVNPGTFVQKDTDDFATIGISFFMSLPCYGDAEENFKLMLQTAQKIQAELGGNLLDSERKMITPDKISQLRTMVRNFNA